jgi:FMN phosphatase YigB (HAD superfamily)
MDRWATFDCYGTLIDWNGGIGRQLERLFGAGQVARLLHAYHERELQVLQSEAPGRWTLKSPAHCFGLDALVARYPDARFVMTHRDPVAVVASVCSLVRSLSGTFSDADHSAYIAAHWTDVVAGAVERVADFRRREGDDRFVDVRYSDLVADPVGEVRRIYAHVGDELGDDAARRMAAYVDANPQGVRGRHRYTLDELGLEQATLEERFADYRAAFGV